MIAHKHICFQLMCRQGRRFSKAAQATNQCPTSSTSCGYFEFSSGDQKNGNPTTGVYDCVDGGILFEDSGEVDDDLEDRHRNVRVFKNGSASQKIV